RNGRHGKPAGHTLLEASRDRTPRAGGGCPRITRAPCRKVMAARHQKDAPAGRGACRGFKRVVGLRPTLTIYTCWLTRTLHGDAALPVAACRAAAPGHSVWHSPRGSSDLPIK